MNKAITPRQNTHASVIARVGCACAAVAFSLLADVTMASASCAAQASSLDAMRGPRDLERVFSSYPNLLRTESKFRSFPTQ